MTDTLLVHDEEEKLVYILRSVFEEDTAVNKQSIIDFCNLVGKNTTYSEKGRQQVYHIVNNVDKGTYSLSRVYKQGLPHTYYSLPQTVNLLRAQIEATALEKELLNTITPWQVFVLLNGYIEDTIAAFSLTPGEVHEIYSSPTLTVTFNKNDMDDVCASMTVTYRVKGDLMHYISMHTYTDSLENKSFVSDTIRVQ
jgi:hypothetical protein